MNGFRSGHGHGFTLVEVLVALAMVAVTMCVAVSVYVVQQRQFVSHRERHAAAHNLWAGLMVMAQEIQRAGYDPEDTGRFGIVDIRRYDPVNPKTLHRGGQPVFYYTCDSDEDGGLDPRNKGRNKEHPKFMIAAVDHDGARFLAWDNGSGRRPIAPSIEAMAFAFALDGDADGRIDTIAGSDHLVWAIDSDNDNWLDTNIDTNGDGTIDLRDDANADGVIDARDGGGFDQPIALDAVRMVKVWLMARSVNRVQGPSEHRRLTVGARVIELPDDGFHRVVATTSIKCRNM